MAQRLVQQLLLLHLRHQQLLVNQRLLHNQLQVIATKLQAVRQQLQTILLQPRVQRPAHQAATLVAT